MESKHDRVIDVPLDIKVPGEMVGALYLITDKEDNEFYLSTHDIQAKDALEGEAIWKKWLTLTDVENEGVERSRGMLDCIEKHKME